MRTMINQVNYCTTKQQQTMICDQDASTAIIYAELNALGNRSSLKSSPNSK